MSNDAEHRAAFGLIPGPCYPNIHFGGISEVYIGPMHLSLSEEDWDEAIAKGIVVKIKDFKATPKHDEHAANGGHKINFTLPAPQDFPKSLKGNDGFMQMAQRRGEKFIMDNLKKSYNVMNCPECAMPCDKTHDGYIAGTKGKYEFFHCYNCKKNFKISL